MELEFVKVRLFAFCILFLDDGMGQKNVLDAVVLAVGALLEDDVLFFLRGVDDLHLLLCYGEHQFFDIGKLDHGRQLAQQRLLFLVLQFTRLDPLASLCECQDASEILVDEVDILNKRNLLEAN